MHNCLSVSDRHLLVVLDEALRNHEDNGEKFIWMLDVRAPSNPVSISTFPQPCEIDYKTKPGHFRQHNLHENRPGSFISSDLIFATYQNADVHAFDVSDPYRPVEVAAFAPP